MAKMTYELKVQVDPGMKEIFDKISGNLEEINALLKENRDLLATAFADSLEVVSDCPKKTEAE